MDTEEKVEKIKKDLEKNKVKQTIFQNTCLPWYKIQEHKAKKLKRRAINKIQAKSRKANRKK